MKKIIIPVIGTIAFVLVIIPLLLPSSFEVERSIKINKEASEVYSKVVHIGDWQDWSPWYAMEPNAEYQFEGTPGVVGSIASWSGEKIGMGRQTLTKLIANEYIEAQLVFIEPNGSEATSYFKFDETDGSTMVTWGIKGQLSYPIERFVGLFFEGMIGKDYEKGLKSLKEVLEK